MEISNFSEFLLEKKKDKSGSDNSKEDNGEPIIWKPGSGPWFLEYFSQIKSEKDKVNIIKITEEVLLKLAKDGFTNIDSSLKWEKLYQFAKYCLKGEKFDYPSFVWDKKEKGSKTEPGLLSEILGIDVDGKTIDKILSNDVKNDDLADYIGGIYKGIKAFIESKKATREVKQLFGDEIPQGFNDLGVISLLAGLYQPKNVDKGKPIFITESTPAKLKTPGTDGKGWNGTTVTDENKKKAGDWPEGWNIPIEPLRLRTIMKNSEMCLRTSSACIKEISLLFSSAEESDAIVKPAEDIIKEITTAREALFGPGEEETGTMYKFWEAWEAADADKIKLITGGTVGFTIKMYNDFIGNIELGKNEIQKAKGLVDSGEMSMEEYFRNVEAYTEDKDDKKIKVAEGLRKVMYEEIKDGISDLQAAIENYTTAPGEKNALDQYLKVYNEFISKAKSNYTVNITDGNKKIEVKK
jgi:hypothetical protein